MFNANEIAVIKIRINQPVPMYFLIKSIFISFRSNRQDQLGGRELEQSDIKDLVVLRATTSRP